MGIVRKARRRPRSALRERTYLEVLRTSAAEGIPCPDAEPDPRSSPGFGPTIGPFAVARPAVPGRAPHPGTLHLPSSRAAWPSSRFQPDVRVSHRTGVGTHVRDSWPQILVGTVKAPRSATLMASGGNPSYAWSVMGSWPPGRHIHKKLG